MITNCAIPIHIDYHEDDHWNYE